MKKFILIIIIILSVSFAICGYLVSANQPPYSIEGTKVMYIKDEVDFINYTKNYNKYDQVYLTSNISVSNVFESIGKKESIFNSAFDGQGYSISLSDEISNIPLFNIIGENGIVKNLELSISECNVYSSSFGFLAIQNKGTINNIIIKVKKLSILKDTMLGLIVGLNTGTISYCYAESKIVNKIDQPRKDSVIGGCCGFNNGIIKSVIINCEFQRFLQVNKDNVLVGTINNSYGIICGVNNKAKEGIITSYYLSKDEYIYSDSVYVDVIELLTEDILLNKYLFNNKIWKINKSSSSEDININLVDGATV